VIVDDITLWVLTASCLAITTINVVAFWIVEHYKERWLRKLAETVAELYGSLEVLERERRFVEEARCS